MAKVDEETRQRRFRLLEEHDNLPDAAEASDITYTSFQRWAKRNWPKYDDKFGRNGSKGRAPRSLLDLIRRALRSAKHDLTDPALSDLDDRVAERRIDAARREVAWCIKQLDDRLGDSEEDADD